MKSRFADAMAKLPLVAILRGVTPDESPAILRALIGEGFLLIEVPLNSPEPYESIRAMRALAPPEALVGAGTVRTPKRSKPSPRRAAILSSCRTPMSRSSPRPRRMA